jgi:hypothetical protein
MVYERPGGICSLDMEVESYADPVGESFPRSQINCSRLPFQSILTDAMRKSLSHVDSFISYAFSSGLSGLPILIVVKGSCISIPQKLS